MTCCQLKHINHWSTFPAKLLFSSLYFLLHVSIRIELHKESCTFNEFIWNVGKRMSSDFLVLLRKLSGRVYQTNCVWISAEPLKLCPHTGGQNIFLLWNCHYTVQYHMRLDYLIYLYILQVTSAKQCPSLQTRVSALTLSQSLWQQKNQSYHHHLRALAASQTTPVLQQSLTPWSQARAPTQLRGSCRVRWESPSHPRLIPWLLNRGLKFSATKLSKEIVFELALYVWIGLILNLINWIMITMNWTLIGLNWTVSLKCLEMTFVVIWRFISKTELKLNWILAQK